MFQINDLILYGNTGVCRVDAIGNRPSTGLTDKNTVYYTLSLLYGGGQIYVPVDSPLFMRPIMNREQAMELIHHIPDIQVEPFSSRDHRMLAEHYRGLLQSHDSNDLLQLIRSIYAKGQLKGTGKKMNSTDQQYFRRATDLLHGELAAALNIPLNEVETFIAAEIEKIS